MRLLYGFILIFLFSCSQDKKLDLDASELHYKFDVLKVMEDAELQKRNYRVSVAFKSPLPITEVQTYIVDINDSSISDLGLNSLTRIQTNVVEFKAKLDSKLYAVYHLKGVGYSYHSIKPAEFLCFQPIDNEFIKEVLYCNYATSSLFILAKGSRDRNVVVDGLFDVETINRWINYSSDNFYNTQTLQNFTSIISVPMTYLSKNPKLVTSSIMKQGFINVFQDVVDSYIDRISTRQYADIESFESALKTISSSFQNIGYKIYQDKEQLFDIALNGIPLVQKHNIYIEDFFDGKNDISIINKKAYRIGNVDFDQKTNLLTWVRWPWMKKVIITYEVNGETFSKTAVDNIVIPLGVETIVIEPFGLKGKYQKSQIDLSKLKEISGDLL
jgi:hypothetical protein